MKRFKIYKHKDTGEWQLEDIYRTDPTPCPSHAVAVSKMICRTTAKLAKARAA